MTLPVNPAGTTDKMEEQFIDVQETERYYNVAVCAFKANEQISQRNKELVLRFLRDAALGKTVLHKAKKKIGTARLLNYVKELHFLIEFLSKDLDEVTQQDMEMFIEALETGRVMSRAKHVYGNPRLRPPRPVSEQYQVDIKFTIKKFYKWLWGKNKVYPEIVEWIDTYSVPKEIASLTEAEMQRMLDKCSSVKQRALIQVLFDGGFRIGELLNIRLRHVRMHWFDPSDPSKRCFVLRVPYSKTLPRSVAVPMTASTKWLSVWLEEHPATPAVLPDGTIEASDVTMQLFPMSLTALRQTVNRVGRRALGKRVYPHLLRHTSATYWANKLSYFQMCKRFGWSMTSKMPQRYIDRAGVHDMEVARVYLLETESRG